MVIAFLPNVHLLEFCIQYKQLLGKKGEDMTKKAIVSVSFGTNDPETGRKNLDVLEADYKASHPECSLYRVLTNDAVVESLREEGNPVYAVRECMARLVLDGITHLFVQPAYILNGTEYDELTEKIYSHKADFVSVKVGRPLLSSHEDFENVCRALMDDYRDLAGDEAAVFIGHGSDHHGNVVYCALDYIMKDLGYGNAHIGTFKAYPQIDTVIRHLEKSGIHHVHVAPFMFVAGVSAMEGVCGDAVNSMKKQLESAGFTVTAHRKCLGEYDGIRKIYLDHLNACMAD